MSQSLTDVLTNVSHELDSLARLTVALQDQLSPQGCAGLEIEGLQSLDTLTQTLRCLATVLARLPAATSCNCSVATSAAFAEISLSGVIRRLGGSVEDDAAHEPCDLF